MLELYSNKTYISIHNVFRQNTFHTLLRALQPYWNEFFSRRAPKPSSEDSALVLFCINIILLMIFSTFPSWITIDYSFSKNSSAVEESKSANSFKCHTFQAHVFLKYRKTLHAQMSNALFDDLDIRLLFRHSIDSLLGCERCMLCFFPFSPGKQPSLIRVELVESFDSNTYVRGCGKDCPRFLPE